jgi:hypothetical protein
MSLDDMMALIWMNDATRRKVLISEVQENQQDSHFGLDFA